MYYEIFPTLVGILSNDALVSMIENISALG